MNKMLAAILALSFTLRVSMGQGPTYRGVFIGTGPGTNAYLGVQLGGNINLTNEITRGSFSFSLGQSNVTLTSFPTAVTNYSDNTTVIYGSGANDSSYNRAYYSAYTNVATSEQHWTNAANSHMVVRNDPAYGASYTVEDSLAGADGFFSLGEFISNPLAAYGSTTGTMNLFYGTNIGINPMVQYTTSAHQQPFPAETNVLYIAPWGNDLIANRTNGFPFLTPYAANLIATNGDIILLAPGKYYSRPFYSGPGIHWKGSGINSTYLEMIREVSFTTLAFVLNTNVELEGITFTNSQVICGHGAPDPTNCYVHDIEIYAPGLAQITNTDVLPITFIAAISSMSDMTWERVHVHGAWVGFLIGENYSAPSPYSGTVQRTVRLIDCTADMRPEYASGNYNVWALSDYLNSSGGMQPIAWVTAAGQGVQGGIKGTLYVQGGQYSTMNGGTNVALFYGSTSLSRNAGLWIGPTITNVQAFVHLEGPNFIYGSSNSTAVAILNESSNNAVRITGYWGEQEMPGTLASVGTNYLTATAFQLKDARNLNTNVFILTGPGTPLNVIAAPVGSVYYRNNGSGNTYIKTNGTSTTGWYDTLLRL